MPQAGHVGSAFPGGGRVQVQVPVRVGIVARQRAAEFEHPVLQVALDAEAGVDKDLLHLGVVQQDRRGEGGHAPLDGVGYQVLQQQRAEPVTMHLICHGEGDFGLLAAAADLVAGDARDLAVAQGQQGLVPGCGQSADPFCFLLRRQAAVAEESQVRGGGGHGLVHRLHGGQVPGENWGVSRR